MSWEGPHRISDYLGNVANSPWKRPPEAPGVYIVSENPWRYMPTHNDNILHVGQAAYLRYHVGRLLCDLLGFTGDNPSAEEAYHAAQERGFTWGAVRAPESLLDDPHLHDRGFWKQVEQKELGRSFVYPGEAAIYSDSPWRIASRAPLVGEHNVEILCGELGLSLTELSVLAENRVI